MLVCHYAMQAFTENKEAQNSHLDLATMQFCLIQLNSFLNCFNFNKFHISKAFWLTIFVGQDSHSVDSATRIKVLLHFFWSACIVNLQW
jgi:hypothetical protein